MQHTKKKRQLTESQGKLAADHIDLVDRHISYLVRKKRIECREIDDLRGYLEQQLCIAAALYDADKGSFPFYAMTAFRSAHRNYYTKRNTYRKHFVLVDMRTRVLQGEHPRKEPKAPEEIRFDVSFLLESLCGDEKKVIQGYLKGFTTEEIAETFNRPTQWVGALYCRAVKKLKTITTWRLLEFGDFRSG